MGQYCLVPSCIPPSPADLDLTHSHTARPSAMSQQESPLTLSSSMPWNHLLSHPIPYLSDYKWHDVLNQPREKPKPVLSTMVRAAANVAYKSTQTPSFGFG